ncbi:MAG: prepilin-type N-terminal cleavage/methylation domain-containing protein [Phycisphaerales bacterium JB050]
MNRRHAFTLVEVILSLAILVVLASSIGWAVREMREKTMVLRRASDDLTLCTTVFDLLDSAVTNGLALDPTRGGAGIRGESDSIEIVSRGVLADLEGDISAFAGLTRLRIEFDPQALQLSIGRSAASESASLQPITRRIEHMRFRYHDGQQWVDSFDSRSNGGLPVAIEAAVWFTTPLEPFASLPESEIPFGLEDESVPAGAFEFDGMGAPMRSDFETEQALPERRPDRFRIFAVLDGPTAGDSAIETNLLIEGAP